MREQKPIQVAQKSMLLSQYNVGDKIGFGGNSVVRCGVRKVGNHPVAIKVMNRRGLKPHQIKSVRNEVEILKSLDHSNIVKFLDFFEEGDFSYLVTEHISGGELYDRIVAKSFYDETQAKVLFETLLKAVKYLHDRKIVHRDLKPENLMLKDADNDINLAIIDFGFAAQTDGTETLTGPCGSLNYCAPEVLQEKPHGLPVDMWSCGVILYVMLSGCYPFEDDDQRTLHHKITQGIFTFYEGHRAIVSEDAKDLIRGLLSVDPLQRLTVDQALSHPWLQKRLHQRETTKHASKYTFGKIMNALRVLRNFKYGKDSR